MGATEMADIVCGHFNDSDSVEIHCPACQQKAVLRLAEGPGRDGFIIDARGHMTPEYVCLEKYRKPNGQTEYCEYCGFLTVLMKD